MIQFDTHRAQGRFLFWPKHRADIPFFFESMAFFSSLLLIMALPFSHAWIRLFLSLTLVLVAVSIVLHYTLTTVRAEWQAQYKAVKQSHVAVLAAALFLIHVLSLFHSVLPLKASLHSILKQTELLYPFVFMPLFKRPEHRKMAVHALLIALLINSSLATMNVLLGLWPLAGLIGPPMINPIVPSVLTAFGLYILFYRLLSACKQKVVSLSSLVYLLLSLFFIYYLTQINHEKVGILIAVLSLGLLLWQTMGQKGLMIALLVVPLSLGGLYFGSSKLRERMTELKQDLTTYQYHPNTSTGYRLSFARYSFKLIKERPLTGFGTGSFSYEYAKTGGPVLSGKSHQPGKVLRTPHNTYLLIWVELGLIGLVVLLVWMGVQVAESVRLSEPERYWAQGFILTFVVSSVCFNPMMLKPIACFYSVFLSVLYASRLYKAE